MGIPTVNPLFEQWHSAGFIVSEANGHMSRDQISLAAGPTVLPGTILGMLTGAASSSATAMGTPNAGNGTFGPITQAANPSQIGIYGISFTSPTTYTVTAPNGVTATGTTGTAFSALGVGFTVAAGATPFSFGDGFNVTIAANAGFNTASVLTVPGNIGNGTVSVVTPQPPAVVNGIYTVMFTSPTAFTVTNPRGQTMGSGATGAAFGGGGLSFTITAGTVPFAAGDDFAITASVGPGQFTAWNPANSDGSQTAVGILYGIKNASNSPQPAVAIVRECEVNGTELVWPLGVTPAQMATAITQLRAQFIVVR
jgi:hypothetical protein